MSKGLVLITGVNGYIAAVTAKHFLDEGYAVRGTVRRLESAKPLLEDAFKHHVAEGTFTVVEVPDIASPTAFDDVVKGVTHIAHIAHPVTFEVTDPDLILRIATSATVNILNSALTYAGSQLRSVLLMSSIAAVMNRHAMPYTITERDWSDWAEEEVKKLGKDVPGAVMYSAGKAAGEKAFWKWKEENNPPWAMAAVNPVFVIGPPVLPVPTPEALPMTLNFVYLPMIGVAGPVFEAEFPQYVVDVRDVAALTYSVLMLPKTESDGERYIAASAVQLVQATSDILRRVVPDLSAKVIEGKPGEGYVVDENGVYRMVGEGETVMGVDARKAEGVLARKWRGLEEMVRDSAVSLKGIV